MPDLDKDFRRLAARGDFRIQPAVEYEKAGTEIRDGQTWEASIPRPCVALVFWPRGQYGNPFCRRGFAAATLAEVLTKAVDATRPPSWSLETLVSRLLYEQARKRREATNA
jgi:hypothetical protein